MISQKDAASNDKEVKAVAFIMTKTFRESQKDKEGLCDVECNSLLQIGVCSPEGTYARRHLFRFP